jgi:hypothetical protein
VTRRVVGFFFHLFAPSLAPPARHCHDLLDALRIIFVELFQPYIATFIALLRAANNTQTQTQHYGCSQRCHEDEDDAEEIVAENYEDDNDPGMQDGDAVRAVLIGYISDLFVPFQLNSAPL